MALARHRTPLGDVLREEGRTQVWLAGRVGVQPRAVWTWVHGIHEPDDDTKQRIADALGRTERELFPPDEVAA